MLHHQTPSCETVSGSNTGHDESKNLSLTVTEIYASIQGESSYAGLPCVFIRLSGCPLRCRWCDTVYSYKAGEAYSISNISEQVKRHGISLVEITGGEPLAQPNTPQLIHYLLQQGYEVLIETSGSEPIDTLDPRTHIIMDLKCPDSKMEQHNLYKNIEYLKASDEVKFVIASRKDFDWALDTIKQYHLEDICKILLSCAFGLIQPAELVSWMLEAKVKARLNLQQHKYIWSPKAKGV